MDLKRHITHALRRVWPKQYHFIHIPKNGGNSVRAAMGLNVSLSSHFHHRYIDVADDVGRDLRFFCVVRNPWSRTASRYWFVRQNAAKWPVDDLRRVYIEKSTFAEYVRDHKIFDVPEHPGKPWMGPMNSWFNQLEWIRDESGEVVCDCLRLEHLDEDMAAYFGRRFLMPHRNQTRLRRDYRTMYDDALIQIVADMFREDIRYFGFRFGTAATRNFVTEPPSTLMLA
jgi:hypothetical protein